MDHSNVVNENELEWAEQSHGKKFGYRRKSLSSATGGEKLGCSLYEVPPGLRAWPYHYHLANEEAIYVLQGSGTLRIGEREVAVSRGDYVALPVEESGAHQIINTSDEALRYLCFSTMVEPDVMVYPDSDKIGLFAGSAPGGPKEKRTLSKFLREDAEVGYYEGEE
ncbi:MAG: Cupin domain protein [uncultured Rubrobacteraceae bacterium]|uniref:Cupin domain protein n=1 Tax=uncultured Rubrobacteraceae bacterium TaxID=349277 RepID=A0A6J4Q141_9ACTN|nr:MAG: Cupin domain protein [uncultured Rubrobacteraceae bacterium]